MILCRPAGFLYMVMNISDSSSNLFCHFRLCMGMNYGAAHVKKVRFLYKTILRVHRELPVALQTLGNSYLKDEFKRHKNCNQAEAAQFMMEWTVSKISTIIFYFIMRSITLSHALFKMCA